MGIFLLAIDLQGVGHLLGGAEAEVCNVCQAAGQGEGGRHSHFQFSWLQILWQIQNSLSLKCWSFFFQRSIAFNMVSLE